MEKLRSKALFTCIVFFLLVILSLGSYALAQDLKVGITQIVEHPALDGARQGFIDYLAEHGYVEGKNISYDIQNAQGDMSTANTIAKKFEMENLDLVLAIATPTAQAAANVIDDIPILITAVTDPVGAGLVESMETPNTNVTGTSDLSPDLVKKQIELLLKFKPELKVVGTVYNAGESNSLTQVEAARKACDELGLTLVEATADNSSSVLQAAQSLTSKVEGIYVFTDNTVVSALESVVKVAEDNKLPLVVGEEDSVRRGGMASVSISYYNLGRQTGEMALKIIEEGAKPQTMPVERPRDLKLVINEQAIKNMGFAVPEDLKAEADEIYGQE